MSAIFSAGVVVSIIAGVLLQLFKVLAHRSFVYIKGRVPSFEAADVSVRDVRPLVVEALSVAVIRERGFWYLQR